MMETRNWHCSCWVSGWDRSRSRRRSRWPSIDCRRFLPTSLPVDETCRTCPICSDVGSFRTCPPSSAQALCVGASEVRGCRWREGTIEREKSLPLSPLSVSCLLSAWSFLWRSSDWSPRSPTKTDWSRLLTALSLFYRCDWTVQVRQWTLFYGCDWTVQVRQCTLSSFYGCDWTVQVRQCTHSAKTAIPLPPLPLCRSQLHHNSKNWQTTDRFCRVPCT